MGDFNVEPLKTDKTDNGKLFYNIYLYCNQLRYIRIH